MRTSETQIETGVRFMRLSDVVAACGLSKTEIYRRVAAGRFPQPRKYPDSHRTFWPSTEVVAWQQQILAETAPADEFDSL